MTSVRNSYFTEKFRPVNSRGEESSQPSPYPSLLPLLSPFLLVTLERILFNWKALQILDRNMETGEMAKRESSLQRVMHLSMLCLAFCSQM